MSSVDAFVPSWSPGTEPGGTLPGVDDRRIVMPGRRPRTIRRNALLNDLATTADDIPLVLLTAPAGYGKTTVLSQWAAADPRPFAWVDLHESDDNPDRLLRHLALALQRVRPLAPAVWRGLGAPTASVTGVALPRLVTVATTATEPWVLVLDDAHVLKSTVAGEIVVKLANALPLGFHLVLSGRGLSELRLGGLRSRGKCVEFGARELALTADEVGELLATTEIRPSMRAVASLLRRTEGWAAGAYLVTLALRGRHQPDSVATQIAGSTGYIFDYLREEVLARESAETVRFLLRTSPLESMTGPLCDAVLGTTGSTVRLAELADRHLFVTPEDADRHSYRYHPLFGEMLLAELRRRAPSEEAQTHRRAAAWYEWQGDPDPAIVHALAAGDMPRAARLIGTHGRRYVDMGRVHAVRGWLFRLADTALAEHPALAVVAGWTWALTGDPARAHECLRAAESACPGIDEAGAGSRGEPGLLAAVLRLRAGLAPAGVVRMLADARRAEEIEPPGAEWYPLTAALHGMALLFNDEPDAAIRALERAAHFAPDEQRADAGFALTQLVLLFADRGEWAAAEACAVDAWQLIEAGGLKEHLVTAMMHVAQARLALHRRDSRTARRWLASALRMEIEPAPVTFPWLAAQIALELARIMMDLGDLASARRKEVEALRHLARLPVTGTLGRRHALLVEDLDRHRDPAPPFSAMTLTTAEARVLRMLPTHLTLSEIADALFLSRNTVKSQVASIYAKLLASNRAEAVRAARDRRLID
jgi:LuxR family maltose regulon positive regulatory protein